MPNYNASLTPEIRPLLCLVEFYHLRHGLISTLLGVPIVFTRLPGQTSVHVHERHQHVVHGVRNDHVVVDGHHGTDDHHTVADTCGYQIHTCQFTYHIRLNKHTNTHASSHTDTHISIHTLLHTYQHIYTSVFIHQHTHTSVYIHISTHTTPHTHQLYTHTPEHIKTYIRTHNVRTVP